MSELTKNAKEWIKLKRLVRDGYGALPAKKLQDLASEMTTEDNFCLIPYRKKGAEFGLLQPKIPSHCLNLEKELTFESITPTGLTGTEIAEQEFPIGDVVFSKTPISLEKIRAIVLQLLANQGTILPEKTGEKKNPLA